MQRIELVNDIWVNEKNEAVGEIIKITNTHFAILTPTGETKTIQQGWLDSENNFFPICLLPYHVCANNCCMCGTKYCRLNLTMHSEGLYIAD